MSEKKRELLHEVGASLEQEFIGIDEEKLPIVLSGRLELLAKTNEAYDMAKTREQESRKRVSVALKSADDLIRKAKGAGKNTAETHSLFGVEWTTKRDEIDALKANLRELIACGIESAEAQKELVEVQSALAESQAALLYVQETQMAYQAQIADATKFLYGLSAYNMASVQSVLINLEAVLSGASKEKLGEMAQKQLLLAMDQLKNQENIVLRIQENRQLIEDIDLEIAAQAQKYEVHDRLIQEGEEHDRKQDLKIAAQAQKDEEHDRLIQEGEEHDRKQDLEIAAQAQKDEVHDRLIQEREEHDKKQDLEIATQAQKGEVHDRLIREGEEHDKEQDLKIEAQAQKDEEHDKKIKYLEEKCSEFQKQLDEQKKLGAELIKGIEGLKTEKADKVGILVAYGMAGASLLFTIIQFFM